MSKDRVSTSHPTKSLKFLAGMLIAATVIAACGPSSEPTPTPANTATAVATVEGTAVADATVPSTGNVLQPAADSGAANTDASASSAISSTAASEATAAPAADASSALQSPLAAPTAIPATTGDTSGATGAVTDTVDANAAGNTPTDLGPATSGTFEQDSAVCKTLLGEDVPEAVASYLRCGYYVVPELHAQPEGTKIKLPVIVIKSAAASPASDPLVVLQGGPGGSAIREYYSFVINASFRPALDRDVILVDQRGSSLAEPALTCPEYREVVLKRIQAGSGAGAALQERLAANEACRKRLTDAGVNLAAYNSFENADDIAALPAALGYGSYNIYGFSYGSLLAQHILARHPQNVRSVILDGVMPRAGQLSLSRNANFQLALQKVAAACTADALCAKDYPNITDRFIKLIGALDATPEPMKIDTMLQDNAVSMDAPLTGNRLLNTMYYMLYDSFTISRLPRLVDLVEKKDLDYLGRLRNEYELESLELTTYGLSNSILCSEDARFNLDDAQKADAATRQELNLFRTADEILQTCQIWNVPQLDISADQAITSEVPVLVLNGELDPVTPPETGKKAIAGFTNATSVTFRGMGHGQINGINRCAETLAGNFLNAPTAELDTKCVSEEPALEFSTTSLQLKEFTSAAAGVGSKRPVGWIEIAPGQFVDDVTAAAIGFQAKAEPDLTSIQRTLEQADAKRIASRTTKDSSIEWSIYEGQSNGLFVDYAVSNDGAYIIDLVTATDEQRKALYETAFLPALDAFVAVKAPEQNIVLGAPTEGGEVTSPVEVSGVASKTPFENNLVYRIFNSQNLIIAEGPINVKGELGQPGTFVASLPFTVTQREPGRIEVIDIDAATGSPLATGSVSVTLAPVNVEKLAVPVSITIDSPEASAPITSPLQVKGSISRTPFENNLVYRVVDSTGAEIGSGFITTQGDLGKPATFDAAIVFTPTVTGAGRLFVEDVNAAGGAPFATAAVDVQLTGPTASVTSTEAMTATQPAANGEVMTPTQPITLPATVTDTTVITPSPVMTIPAVVTDTTVVTPSQAVTLPAILTDTTTITPSQVVTIPAVVTPTTPVSNALPPATVFNLKGISLNPAGVARRVVKVVRPAVANVPDEPPLVNGLPTRVQYTFDRDRLSSYFSPRERQLLIMPIEEFRAIVSSNDTALSYFDNSLAKLKEILVTKPASVTGEIPVFPPLGAAQVFVAQLKYLEFDGGTCVRFVTAYAQDASPITDDKLFYTCQGITNDGKFLVSFYYPVSSVATPANFRRIPRATMAEFERDPDGYFTRIIAQLNKLSPRSFAPYLTRMDTVMQSLTIEEQP